MPNCFSLTRKGDSTPTHLHQIDKELCEVVGDPVDPVKWCCNWYNYLGLRFALGHRYADIRKDIDTSDESQVAILDYLEANYVVNSWYER